MTYEELYNLNQQLKGSKCHKLTIVQEKQGYVKFDNGFSCYMLELDNIINQWFYISNLSLIKTAYNRLYAKVTESTSELRVDFTVACTATYKGSLTIPRNIKNNDEKILEFIRKNLDNVPVKDLEWLSDIDPKDAVTKEDIRGVYETNPLPSNVIY